MVTRARTTCKGAEGISNDRSTGQLGSSRLVYRPADVEGGTFEQRPVIPDYDEYDALDAYNASRFGSNEKALEALRRILGYVGKDVVVRRPFHVDMGGNVKIGSGSFLNFDCMLLANDEITIGKRVFIAPRVTIITVSHPLDAGTRFNREYCTAPVEIGDDAWIGAGATLLPGVRIGKSAIVAAGAVVTRDVPENSIAAGVPARVIGKAV